MDKEKSQIHRAGWIMIDSRTILRNGFIKVEKGRITDSGQGNGWGEAPIIDHGPGLIMPSLVNTHTHLELCALKDQITFGNGLIQWVQEVILKREAAGDEKLTMEAKKGMADLFNSGCKLAGEISTLGLTRDIFFQSNLMGIWFREFLGNRGPEKPNDLAETGSSCSMAVHAPHSTHPELMADIFKTGQGNHLPVSIHVSESEEEIEFLTTGKGAWADLLTARGIDYSNWGLPVKRPLLRLEQSGLLNEKTIAVHLIHTDSKDHEILLRNRVHVCLCPRSNHYLYGRLPDIDGMLQAGIKPCLGTDSLASNDSLDMFDEMAYLANSFPNIRPETILDMATIHGAVALGFQESFGTLSPGKVGSMIYVPMEASNPKDLLESLVNKHFMEKIDTGHM